MAVGAASMKVEIAQRLKLAGLAARWLGAYFRGFDFLFRGAHSTDPLVDESRELALGWGRATLMVEKTREPIDNQALDKTTSATFLSNFEIA